MKGRDVVMDLNRYLIIVGIRVVVVVAHHGVVVVVVVVVRKMFHHINHRS